MKIAIDENEDPWDDIDEVNSESSFTEEIEKAIDEEVQEEFLN